jgi:hypothetical protein
MELETGPRRTKLRQGDLRPPRAKLVIKHSLENHKVNKFIKEVQRMEHLGNV